MVFVAESEELTLHAFKTEGEAISACQGLDVEAGTWLFWSDEGAPLEPLFLVPNQRGLFSAVNGVYTLVPATQDPHAHLEEALEQVLRFECQPPLDSAAGIRSYLESRKSKTGSR